MLNHLHRCHAWLVTRTGGSDRGDNPVPTAIIIAGLAAFAIVVPILAL